MSSEAAKAARRKANLIRRAARATVRGRARARARLATLTAALALVGCGQAPRETFDLSGPVGRLSTHAPARKTRATLSVLEPSAVAPTDTNRIVMRTSEQGVAVLADSQWSDRLTRLMQQRLLTVMQRAGVSAVAPGVVADVALHSDIRRFEIDVARGQAVVEIAAQLIDDRSGRMRGARVFIAESPVPDTAPATAARVLEAAADDAARQVAVWARAQI